jgi:hypothetical protein
VRSELLGIDWFVVEDSRRKSAINVLFLCEMAVSLYVVGFCFMYNIHDVHLPIDVYFSCLFFESFAKITVFLLKLDIFTH